MFLNIIADTRPGSVINAPLAARGTVLDLHSLQKMDNTISTPSDSSFVAVSVDEVTGGPSSEIGNAALSHTYYLDNIIIYLCCSPSFPNIIMASRRAPLPKKSGESQ